MYRREKQRGTVRGNFIVLLHREILSGRIFLTVEAPPGKSLLKKNTAKHVQEGKTKRYCTWHIYRPPEPRNSGWTHFLYCRRASRQQTVYKKTQKTCTGGKQKRYCTRQIYRPLAPRNSGRTHFPHCRSASRQNAVQEKTRQNMYRRKKQTGTVRGKFIVLLHREVRSGRIFLTIEGPPDNTLLRKIHNKHVKEGKTKRYCTRQTYRPLAPRNSGRTQFPYCRSASRQNTAQEKTPKTMYRREKQRGTVRGMFIVLLNRKILGGRIFLTTVEGPPGNKLLKKRHKKHVLVQEGKTKRYCTRQIYRPLEPRNSGWTHFPFCRRAFRQ